MADDDNIRPLPVKFKKPPDDKDRPQLRVVQHGGCNHRWVIHGTGGLTDCTYSIREGETEVECDNCHTRLDPMTVLRWLAAEESKWMENQIRYHDEMARLRNRARTQCKHCGKMTRISDK